MSQYLNLFLRTGNKFISICSYSRSSAMYKAFSNFVPYEKVKALTISSIAEAQKNLQAEKESYQKEIDKILALKKAIPEFNNSIEEKLEAIHNCDVDIDDLNYEYADVSTAICECNLFISMIEEAKYTDDNNINEIDWQNYLYAGIEAPIYITEESIEV